jgi:uncharacterized membrane protein
MTPPLPDRNNPYAAPDSGPADFLARRAMIANGQTVASSRVWNWFARGLAWFGVAAGNWIVICLILGAMMLLSLLVPLLGVLGLMLLAPVLAGGLMLGCAAQSSGKALRIDHLFDGFQDHFGALAMLGLVLLLGMAALSLVSFLVALAAGGSFAALSGLLNANPTTLDQMLDLVNLLLSGLGMALLLASLVGTALSLPLMMALWFAPVLVVRHNLPVGAALVASFLGCMKNWLPFLLYSIVLSGLAILACLPLMLGWLVLLPVLIGTVYASYEDIYCPPGPDTPPL